MKSYKASIDIMPHKELLDPQGKAVVNNIHYLDIHGVRDARIGKHIELTVEADSENAANEIVENSCKKLLSNPITENYRYTISELASV
ncbi:MAG: phosphoribosylformylglycinamidine synthase subunit PurS [Saprospiraceae bacterium]|nr:phosphoribosylformylglycinamidine synthase subunit PurS [Saprospiraceae bacterium]